MPTVGNCIIALVSDYIDLELHSVILLLVVEYLSLVKDVARIELVGQTGVVLGLL